MSIYLHVAKYIKKYKLIKNNDSVLLAVSGGADSIAMLHILKAISEKNNFSIAVAHLNHSIRGKDADNDQIFVQKKSQSLGIEFYTKKVDVPKLAKDNGISMEMAAREARYLFFKSLIKKHQFTSVATAHNADDQIETSLLRLFRGAGLNGIASIKPVTKNYGITIIHPLINIFKDDVYKYLKENNLDWVEDKTNNDESILRNKIRHSVIPSIENNFNPRFKSSMLRTIQILKTEDAFMSQITHNATHQCVRNNILYINELHKQHESIKYRIVLNWLYHNAFKTNVSWQLVEDILKLSNSAKGYATIKLTPELVALKEYDKIVITKQKTDIIKILRHIKPPDSIAFPEYNIEVSASLSIGFKKDITNIPGKIPSNACISASKLGESNITVRTVMPGDKMRPMGLNGTKKLKNIFIDLKVPSYKRKNIIIFEVENQIIWVPGYRIAEGWQVQDTEKSILLQIKHLK